MRRTAVAVLCLALSGGFAGHAAAGPEDVANRIAGEIMSPYCPGVTLHDCPSDAAIELRDRIVEMAKSGMNRGEIMDVLVAEYGEGIRAAPRPEGAGLVAWILPGLALASGAAAAFFLARRWSGRREDDAPEPAEEPLSDADRQRLQTELDALRHTP